MQIISSLPHLNKFPFVLALRRAQCCQLLRALSFLKWKPGLLIYPVADIEFSSWFQLLSYLTCPSASTSKVMFLLPFLLFSLFIVYLFRLSHHCILVSFQREQDQTRIFIVAPSCLIYICAVVCGVYVCVLDHNINVFLFMDTSQKILRIIQNKLTKTKIQSNAKNTFPSYRNLFVDLSGAFTANSRSLFRGKKGKLHFLLKYTFSLNALPHFIVLDTGMFILGCKFFILCQEAHNMEVENRQDIH